MSSTFRLEDAAGTWQRIRAFQETSGKELDRYVLACTPHSLAEQPMPAAVQIVTVVAGSRVRDIQESMTVNEQGFDPSAPAVGTDAAKQFRADLTDCAAVTLRWSGTGVSAGMFQPVRGGVSELIGIATLREYRGRGLGGMTTAVLARMAFSRGADLVFLTTADDHARRVYRRVGFTDIEQPAPQR